MIALKKKNKETKNKDEKELQKDDLINRLEDSTSFANTHTIIAEMNDVKSWSDEQKKKLIKIALKK